MQKIIYQKNDLVVSTTLFKTARRSYRISDIEKLAIKRPLLWFSLPIALGAFGLISMFQPYLYMHEQWMCIAGFTLLPLFGWLYGSLNVTSKAFTNDIAAFGFILTLINAREALDKVIFTMHERRHALDYDE